jgi:DNA-binding transcriptional MerR regulator
MESRYVRISELARLCGVTVRALDVYLQRGLIAPVLRTPNGYRYFDASLEEPVRAFGALLSHGISLHVVGEVFAASIPLRQRPTPEAARDCMLRAQTVYRNHIATIDRDIARLLETKRALESRIGYCDEQLNSGAPVKIGRPSDPVRHARPGRVVYERVTAMAD